MPNWADVEYKCVGDPKEVRSLHKVLKYMDDRKTSIIENDFGKWWLGNLVDRLDGDWTTFNCRGEITGYRLDGNVLTINHYTAWCEQSGLRENIERAFPSVKVYYRDCEPANCVCSTNDTTERAFPSVKVYYRDCEPANCVCSTNDTTGMYFPEPYCLASFDNQPEFFMTIGEAARHVSGIVRKRVPSKMKAINNALKGYMRLPSNQDMSYSFHEIRIVT